MSRDSGSYLEKMFTFQLFSIVFMVTFLSDVLLRIPLLFYVWLA